MPMKMSPNCSRTLLISKMCLWISHSTAVQGLGQIIVHTRLFYIQYDVTIGNRYSQRFVPVALTGYDRQQPSNTKTTVLQFMFEAP